MKKKEKYISWFKKIIVKLVQFISVPLIIVWTILYTFYELLLTIYKTESKFLGVCKVIMIGLFFYFCFSCFWGILFYFTHSLKLLKGDSIVSFWQCLSFSFFSFLNLESDEIHISNTIGKYLLVIQSLSSIIYISIFSSITTSRFTQRAKNVFFSKSLFLRKINNHHFLSIRIGNKGKELINLKLFFEIVEVRQNAKWSWVKREFNIPSMDKTCSLDFDLESVEFSPLLKPLSRFYHYPDFTKVRVSLTGYEVDNNQLFSISKLYEKNDIAFGGNFLDVFSFFETISPLRGNTSKVIENWKNFNLTDSINKNEEEVLRNMISKYKSDNIDNYFVN